MRRGELLARDLAKHAPVGAGPRPRAGCSRDIDDRQFADWRALLEERQGLFIASERRSFLVSGLRARMRETGYHDYSQYYEYMTSEAQHEEEWSLLVDRLTVHETCFFRHESSMKLVREIVLPEVCVQGGRCSVWSVGCATGEEAYSLAMLIDSYCATLSESCSYRVFGTDISAPSLHHARAGMYLQRRLRNVKESFRTKYCRPVSSVRFSIDSRLRENVEFFLLNLRDLEQAPLRHMNLIFCQNLLIYYERERRLQLINCLAEFLCPGGMLVLGPGEVLNWQHPSMEKVRFDDTLAYRRAV